MVQFPIYLDNHATTRVDPRVIEAMLPLFSSVYGNAGSAHDFGTAAKSAVDDARQLIAEMIGAKPQEILFTSGATESNNLALRGAAVKLALQGRHMITVATEHPSVLDPVAHLAREGFEVTTLPVIPSPAADAGLVRIEALAEAIRDDTVLVSVMMANNEIGAIQPIAAIGRLCKDRGVLFHCDATQGVGRLPVDVESLGVDLLSFTAHKMYGPKGIGCLYVRSRGPRVRLEPQIAGGGQEKGVRSGTLNVPGIVGLAHALKICSDEMPSESARLSSLRDRLYAGLATRLSGIALNGPSLDRSELRLAGNLNVSFAFVEGEAILLAMRDVAVSTGSACSSSHPEPSHVLRALALPDDAIRGSIRFGLGRFTTMEEIDFVVSRTAEVVESLRSMSSLA